MKRVKNIVSALSVAAIILINSVGAVVAAESPKSGGLTLSTNLLVTNVGSQKDRKIAIEQLPAGAMAKDVVWSSSDSSVATFNGERKEIFVNSLKEGVSTITARVGDLTAECLVFVKIDTPESIDESFKLCYASGTKGYIGISKRELGASGKFRILNNTNGANTPISTDQIGVVNYTPEVISIEATPSSIFQTKYLTTGVACVKFYDKSDESCFTNVSFYIIDKK